MRASTIEKPLAECSPKTLSARTRELYVGKFLKTNGWKILFHDVKVWRTQVDLIARAPDGVLTVVEVKSQQPWMPGPQLFRLKKICSFLAEFERVELCLAFVHKSSVTILPVDRLTEF